jgi:glucokinase
MVLDDAPAGPRTLEDFASARGFAAAYRHAGGDGTLSPADIFAQAGQGQGVAAVAIDAVGRRIAQGLGMLINALNLEVCLIGGGIAEAGEPLLRCIRGQLPHFTWPFLLARARVARAQTGQDAGILGASLTALLHPRRPS